MVARAGVPQSAFYEIFESVEDCLSAGFEEGLQRLSEAVGEASGREERWLGKVRAGVVALLGFLDDEPGWGRLLILEAPGAGAAGLECGRRVQGVLGGLLSEGRGEAIAGGELGPSPALTAELVLGGVFSVIRARMLERDGGRLVELAPSLVGFIVTSYLGPAAASAELVGRSAAAEQAPSLAAELPIHSPGPLPVPVSRRTALVLRAIAAAPRSSNREIADAAGITDEGQISHLLRRLARRGLIEKVAPRSGSRRENAWLLTPCGRRVIELLGFASDSDSDRGRPCAQAREGRGGRAMSGLGPTRRSGPAAGTALGTGCGARKHFAVGESDSNRREKEQWRA